MKNKISLLLLTLLILQSCGDRTPIIDGKSPFVVGEIKKYDQTHSKYYSDNFESGDWSSNFEGKPMLILPSKLYQIGDTITTIVPKLQKDSI